jgi:L-2-hydroxyglutarate oxidase LhgO
MFEVVGRSTRLTTSTADVAVIGAGVIGLAVARALAQSNREVFLIEKERFVGFHTSSRNSEVIHAGIYYPAGSLKARLCIEGRHALYDYCEARSVPHARTGKLIVATAEEEIPALEKILAAALKNGVDDLRWLSAAQAEQLEPAVRSVRALLSPSTGIVDSHGFMTALREDAEAAGAQLVLRTPVLSGRAEQGGITLALGGEDPGEIHFRLVVNCAGLWAQDVARAVVGLPAASVPPQHFAKAHYFVLSGPSPFRRLVYPVPVPGGLGTHVTLDMAGRARFGPDVEWVEGVDYRFDESRAESFYRSIRRYFPGLADGQLEPGYTGVRPKVTGPKDPAGDFLVQGPAEHGLPGLINLYGIESPGLTAALPLAQQVLRLARA